MSEDKITVEDLVKARDLLNNNSTKSHHRYMHIKGLGMYSLRSGFWISEESGEPLTKEDLESIGVYE